MIKITSNAQEVITKLRRELSERFDREKLNREAAIGILGEVHHRVHVEGKASDGSQIGTYSKGYMVVRTGAYKNAVKYTRGKKKGEVKSAGKFTKGDKSGLFKDSPFAESRPNYNRSSDTKVILSLTRQMENDFTAIVQDDGSWGIGWQNPINADKAKWNEERYDKKIFDLTEEEKKKTRQIMELYTNKQIEEINALS